MKRRAASFEKWQGLGNDFVVLDALDVLDLRMDPALAVRLCDRRFGVGADGVLVVSREGGVPRMIVYNADGSRPEMCGNGLRCVVGHLAARGLEGAALDVLTDAGTKRCEVIASREDGFDIAVHMGQARFLDDLRVPFEGDDRRFLRVDMGNPHAITFEPWDEALVDRLGPHAATFPAGGTNVEFCRLLPERIEVTVWERGVGRTLACGTGACAVAAAACGTGRVRYGEPLRVVLPGGELRITVSAGSQDVRMEGPAERVFTGEVVLP
jgi:diaminopimelate epimerase